jgi:hypothetical protein
MFELIEVPELQRLQQKVASLEQERNEAEARAGQLRLAVRDAREEDITAEALALNSGKKPPKAREPELRAQLEGAERRRDVKARQHALAQAEVSKYVQAHHGELLEAILEAERREAAAVSEGARELLGKLGRYYALDEDRKRMKPMLPGPPETGPPGSEPGAKLTTMYGGLQTTRSVMGAGPPRGTIEEMLRHLVSLGDADRAEAPPGAA